MKFQTFSLPVSCTQQKQPSTLTQKEAYFATQNWAQIYFMIKKYFTKKFSHWKDARYLWITEKYLIQFVFDFK